MIQIIAKADVVSGFSNSELLVWAPKSDQFYSLWVNALTGHGYWLEGSIINIKQLGIFWPISSLIVLSAAIFGAFLLMKKNLRYGLFSILSMSAGLVFYMGINIPWGGFGDIYQVLYEFWFFRALRESQKFGAIVGTIQILLLAFSMIWLLGAEKIKPFIRMTIIFGLLVSILVSGFGLFNYGNDSIARCDYPEELTLLSEELETSDKVLYIPGNRHGYFSFCNLSTINPGLRLLGEQGIVDQTSYLSRPQIDDRYINQLMKDNAVDFAVVLYGTAVVKGSI